jgi:hypothetical protein
MIKKILFFLPILLLIQWQNLKAQCSSPIISGASTSGNFRGLNPNFGRGCSVYLLTQADMAAAGLLSGVSLTGIGGSFTVAPSITTTGNLSIHLENTLDITNNKSSTWATAITGMTQVLNSTVTVPNALQWNTVFGTPFTYTGGGVYVAIEWTNCGALATSSVVACNTVLATGVKSAQLAACTAIATVSANSSFRPETRFTSTNPNISLVNVWPLGKAVAGASSPETIPYLVRNSFGTSQSVTATLTIKEAISGTVRYTQTQTNTIAGCADGSFAFTGWLPSIAETDSVIITIPALGGELNLTDNYIGRVQSVNNTSITHNNIFYPGTFTGVGFNTGSGLLLAKHSANGCINISAVKARIETSAVGNTIYGVVLNNLGAIIGQSPNYVVQAADANTIVTFPLSVPASISNQDYYIGIAQTANAVGYFPLSCQVENPTKPNAFYSGALLGGGLSLPITNLGRLMIEADFAPTPSIFATIENQNSSYCPGSTFNVNYVATNTTLNAGNIFNIELSDAAGSFTLPTIIGTLNSTDLSGSILATIPSNQPGSGIYKIRMTASNTALTGCSNSTFLNILTPPTFSSVVPTNATCNGGSNGSIVVSSASVLPTFSILPVSTQSPVGTFTNLAANTYTVTVTDGNSCTATSTVDILQPTVLVPSIAATPLCTGGNSTLTGSATGGTPTYTYAWDNGAPLGVGPTLTISSAGTYTLVATDANGCTATSVISVSVLPLPTIVPSASPS